VQRQVSAAVSTPSRNTTRSPMRSLLSALALLVCFGIHAVAQTDVQDGPLLGASLTWEVDRNFRRGTRKVVFTLRSAWAYGTDFGSFSEDPGHEPGSLASRKEKIRSDQAPASQAPKGKRLGMLCFVFCRDTRCDSRRQPTQTVKNGTCVDNDFLVQTHDTDAKYTAGIFTHSLDVDQDAVSVLAYLTFDDAFKSDSLYQRYSSETGLYKGPFTKSGNQIIQEKCVKVDGVYNKFCYHKRSWSFASLKASGATKSKEFFEKCKAPNDGQYCATDCDCATDPNSDCNQVQGRADCGYERSDDGQTAVGAYGAGGESQYLVVPPIPEELVVPPIPVPMLAATFVQLCCSSCGRETFGYACDEARTRLKNYYSPVPSFPLALFQGGASSSKAYDVRLKVSDYDGHILRLLPIRAQNPQVQVAKIVDEGRMKFHDFDPPEGPVVRVEGSFKPNTDSNEGGYMPMKYLPLPEPASRHVIEVLDYMWDENGIEDSLPSIGGAETAATRLGVNQDISPTAKEGGTNSQVLFSTYFQSSTTCPADRIPTWKDDIRTEVDCHYDDVNCFVVLVANVAFSAGAHDITIMEAPGFERINIKDEKATSNVIYPTSTDKTYVTCQDFRGLPTTPGDKTEWDQVLCRDYGSSSPCGCCTSYSSCPEGVPCPKDDLKKQQCHFNAYDYSVQNVGEERVTCFVAKATYCAEEGRESERECQSEQSCFSQPICVRFNIKGREPTFVDPTPLELNSADAVGSIVPGRTDVPACLGYPLHLPIHAKDEDSGDQVRIFVDDELRSTSFFSNRENMYDSMCGTFKPFAGRRNGTNDRQSSIVHLFNAEEDSTIVAKLNSDINWRDGSKSNEAQQSILYELKLSDGNGIETLGDENCKINGISIQTCRQRLVNMDRIICGYAYDNSRERYGRWVGDRPNLNLQKSEKDYRDDHSLGSYVTPRHCWRIKLQAPPVFVTNAAGCIMNNVSSITSDCTPFGHSPGSTVDTTGNRMAYANITMSVLQELDVKFVAYDPNPEDRVKLFVMESPGIPPNMHVGRSTCEASVAESKGAGNTCPRDKLCFGDRTKCECGLTATCDPSKDAKCDPSTDASCGKKCSFCKGDGLSKCDSSDSPGVTLTQNCAEECTAGEEGKCACTGFCPADLSCNRASIRLTWKPNRNDFGKSFFVCVTARDNSNLCAGKGIQGMTERGWYGEQQCMYLEVVPPAFRFAGAWIHEFIAGTSKQQPYGIYVGCTFRLDLIIKEVSVGASYGGKVERSDSLSMAPASVMETSMNIKHERRLMIRVQKKPTCSEAANCDRSELEVTPRLGSEGFYFELCFAGGDQLDMVNMAGVCFEDASRKTTNLQDYKSCNDDSDCGIGKCSPLCIHLQVAKCRYCIKDGPETLRVLMDQFFIDTNWMRIWTLNADSFERLDTDCPRHFDCDQNVRTVEAIDNPELIIKSKTGIGKRILWTGVLYKPVEPEKLTEIACRFRTGLKSLAHNNPDMAVGNGSMILQPGDSVCIGACSAAFTHALLDQQLVPECEGIE
jgi:hypothetical protein